MLKTKVRRCHLNLMRALHADIKAVCIGMCTHMLKHFDSFENKETIFFLVGK